MNDTVIPLAYLFAAACFVLALKWLSHHHDRAARRANRRDRHARRVVATLVDLEIVEYRWLDRRAVVPAWRSEAPSACWSR